MNSKKLFLVLFILIGIISLVIIKVYYTEPIFISKLEEIQKVEIEINNNGKYDTYSIHSKETIEILYNMLANMKIIKVCRGIEADECYGKDPLRIVTFYNVKGDMEVFYVDEPTSIHKIIFARGNYKDSGYIIGKHKTVCTEIDNIIKMYEPVK